MPLASAMQWVSQITSASLTLALLAFGGYWLDAKLQSNPWFLIAGALLGLFGFIYQLIAMTRLLMPSGRNGKDSLHEKGNTQSKSP